MKTGDRVRLICMEDDPAPVPPGSTGTVTNVSDLLTFGPKPFRQISIDWDNGRTLLTCVPPDRLEVIQKD